MTRWPWRLNELPDGPGGLSSTTIAFLCATQRVRRAVHSRKRYEALYVSIQGRIAVPQHCAPLQRDFANARDRRVWTGAWGPELDEIGTGNPMVRDGVLQLP